MKSMTQRNDHFGSMVPSRASAYLKRRAVLVLVCLTHLSVAPHQTSAAPAASWGSAIRILPKPNSAGNYQRSSSINEKPKLNIHIGGGSLKTGTTLFQSWTPGFLRGNVVKFAPKPSRKQKLYIHIGPHKTGTTFFQSWIQGLRGISPSLVTPLIDGEVKSNLWYSVFVDYMCGIGKYKLQHKVRQFARSREHLLAGLREVPNEMDIVISSETFSHCSEDGFERIHDLFKEEYDVYIVGVKRESKTLFLSRFHQNYKDKDSFKSWDILGGDRRAHLCSYLSATCLEALARIFGENRVVTVSYEGMKLAGKELAEVFCEAFSQQQSNCFKMQRRLELKGNASPPHILFSATSLYNRLRIHVDCGNQTAMPHDGEREAAAVSAGEDGLRPIAALPPGGGGGQPTAAAELGADTAMMGAMPGPKDLKAWMDTLEQTGVPQVCIPAAELPSPGCDECFLKSAKEGRLPGRHLYYKDLETLEVHFEVCEYDEAEVWENRDVLHHLVLEVRRHLDCS